jgi:hypothetical protein
MRINTVNKRVIYQILFLFWGVTALAQTRENSWIVPTQKYLKITVIEDGIYKITGEGIAKSGWDLSSVNPEKLQLFYRGQEVAIKINTENESSFKSTDSFLFYGQKNDGSRDSLLYRNADRGNSFHSLYTDESTFFLTVSQETEKRKRINSIRNNSPDLLEEPYHLAQDRIVYTNQFSFNNIIGLTPLLQQSYFENGEGRTGKFIVSDTTAYFQIKLKNRVITPANEPAITYQVNGRSRVSHQLVASFGEQDSTFFSIQPFGVRKETNLITNRYIQDETVRLSLSSTKREPLDWYSMTYIQVVYPQLFLMNKQDFKYFNLKNNRLQASMIFVRDFNTDGLMWNITNPLSPVQLLSNSDKKFTILESSNSIKLAAAQSPKKASKIEATNLNQFENTNADYLIITHKDLMESAIEYAAYRASKEGGSHSPLVVTSQQLYDTFNYGERSPIALRKFAEHMLTTANSKHLLLIGRAISFPDELRSNNYPDLVPTVGYPGSDILLTAGLNDYQQDVQAIPTGRLNATNNAEVINYLEKVKETESRVNPELWQKNILHLSGGQNVNEIKNFKLILDGVSSKVRTGILGGKITSLSKQTNQEIEPIDISKKVNVGLGMITFVGHGSANEIDLNIGYCSPPENGFSNKGKYPIMFFNGCGVGNIFYRYNTLSTDWLLTPEKGAIAVFANSFWSYAYPTQRYLDVLYEKLFTDSSSVNLTIGEIQQATNLQLTSEVRNNYIKANIHQVVLQGDPALRLFPVEKPDFQLTDKGIFITAVNESQPISENDSINVGIILQNNGKFVKGKSLPVLVKQTYQNGTENSITMDVNSIAYRDTVYVRIKKNQTVRQLNIILDYQGEINEYNEENNQAKLQLDDWNKINTRTSFPENILPDRLPPVLEVSVNNKLLVNNDFIAKSSVLNLQLTDNQPLDSVSNYHFQVLLKDCIMCDYRQINVAQRVNTSTAPTRFALDIPFENLQANTYGLRVSAKDLAGNSLVRPYEVQFRVVKNKRPSTLLIFPNPGVGFVQVRYIIMSITEPKSAKILVYNSLGKPMVETEQSAQIGENSYFVDTKQFSAGRYYAMVIINGAEVISAPFVVK